MTPTLTHRDDCPNPATPLQAFMGRMGDPMLTCPACKAWKVARKAEAAPAPGWPPSSGADWLAAAGCSTGRP